MATIHNFTQGGNIPDGGAAYGEGFCITWQRGSLENGRNGAFLIEILNVCKAQLLFYQKSKFPCQENVEALEHLQKCIDVLDSRINRRRQQGILGTHEGN